MDFDFGSYNARVGERQSSKPDTPEFAERIRKEMREDSNGVPRTFGMPRLSSVPCENCKGSGHIRVYTGFFFTREESCPDCNGSGRKTVLGR